MDFDDFVSVGQTVSGTDQYEAKSIFLPQGKKPVMLTETMVNYFEYMVDSNKDGVADAGGAGFAHKLVLDAISSPFWRTSSKPIPTSPTGVPAPFWP